MNESSAHEPRVPADDLPVPAGPATVPHVAQPRQGPIRLVLLNPFAIPIYAVFVIGGMAILVWQIFWGTPVLGLFIGLFMIVPAWTAYRKWILPRVTFDRELGLLKLGWLGLRGRRPLSSVIGIQVMPTRSQLDIPGNNATAQTTYQLNLILDNPAERRLNVMTSSFLSHARSNGRLIADFLGVPIHDSAETPESAAADDEGSSAETHAAEPISIEFLTVESPVVTEQGPDVLIIRPSRLALPSWLNAPWLNAVVWAAWGPFVFLMFLQMVIQGAIGDLTAIAAIVAIAPSFLLLLFMILGLNAHSRARFDRERGTLVLGRSAARPLRCVTAVEVTVGPVCHRAHNFLNLLLDDPHHPRLTLISHADTALVQRAAERVASFLGVSLHDTKRQMPAPGPSGAEGAVNLLDQLDRSAVPPGIASIRWPARVVPKGDDVLVLRPRSLFTWVGLALVTGLGVFLILVWLLHGPGVLFEASGLIVVALVMLVASKPPLLYRDHFDRQAGQLTLGRFGRKRTYPLAKVLAVQLVPGGLIKNNQRLIYQLNLVMADPFLDRLNLTNDSDLEWTRQAGRQVADFLGVAMIDQIADGD